MNEFKLNKILCKMITDCTSITTFSGGSTNHQRTENNEIGERKLPPIDTISVAIANDASALEENLENVANNEEESANKSLGKIVGFTILIVALSVFSVIPWTTVPRTNSIIHQSYWLEPLLPVIWIWILDAANDILNLSIWTNEKSIVSLNVFSRIFSMYALIGVPVYILMYVIWCLILGHNHPLPQLGLIRFPIWIVGMLGLWFILPSNLIEKEDFRRKLRMYSAYFLWIFVIAFQNELLSYTFFNIPTDFQLVVPFMVAACREFDKRGRSYLVKKMMGTEDEPAIALVNITISSAYSFFNAVRLTGATSSTVFCAATIDVFLHSRITYKLIKENNKVEEENPEQANRIKKNKAAKLILAELVEGFTPMIYGFVMVLAFFGPNADLFSDIGNNFWGTPIDDIGKLFYTMFILFSFDTLSAAVNSIILWKVVKVNMLREFSRVVSKYWLFMVLRLSLNTTSYFASKDVNLGLDSSGQYEWITPEGRLSLIYNMTHLVDEENTNF